MPDATPDDVLRVHECLCSSEAWCGHIAQTGPLASLSQNALARRQALAQLLATVRDEGWDAACDAAVRECKRFAKVMGPTDAARTARSVMEYIRALRRGGGYMDATSYAPCDCEGLGFICCPECHGEKFVVTCIDDLCRNSGVCIHGDGESPCPTCRGDGEVRCECNR